MKIFLSWSGKKSNDLATIFKEWLPNVLQYVKPYMSSSDIAYGERWNINLNENLEKSSYGLIFVTPDNIDAPWINFEAGALSKTIESKLVPILYDSDVTILNRGPLKQFQSTTKLDKESIKKLVININASQENFILDDIRLDNAFNIWWPILEEKLEEVESEPEQKDQAEQSQQTTDRELLINIYSLLDDLGKSNERRKESIPPGLIDDLISVKKYVESVSNDCFIGEFDIDDLEEKSQETLKILNKIISYLKFRVRPSKRMHERMNEISD